jgi:hypothetical protein
MAKLGNKTSQNSHFMYNQDWPVMECGQLDEQEGHDSIDLLEKERVHEISFA